MDEEAEADSGAVDTVDTEGLGRLLFATRSFTFRCDSGGFGDTVDTEDLAD